MEKTEKHSHKKRLVVLIVLFALIFASFVPAIICEIRTAIHRDEFEWVTDWKPLTDLSVGERFRILEYTEDSARLYCWHPDYYGNIVTVEKVDSEWRPISWDTVWSTSGSASETVPQYWWHAVYFLIKT